MVEIAQRRQAIEPSEISQESNSLLRITWADGRVCDYQAANLRRACPCAGCKGETDIMGNLYKNPEQPLTPKAFELARIITVGGYAIQPVWADGHSTGLFSFDYLWQVADAK